MAKLKMLSMHKLENIPDHLIQEIQDFSIKLVMHNAKMIEEANPNIGLGALNWMLVIMIKHLVADDAKELRKAAEFSCVMLMKNMDILIDQMESQNG